MSSINRRMGAPAFLCTLAVLVAGCGGNGTGPDEIERSDVVGGYEATTFETTDDGQTTDQLAEGAELTVTLNSDGTTAGNLFVPGGAEDGGDLDASLAGTWTFDANSNAVEFVQSADTFVRDMTFTATREGESVQLEGEESFGGPTITVVLEQ